MVFKFDEGHSLIFLSPKAVSLASTVEKALQSTADNETILAVDKWIMEASFWNFLRLTKHLLCTKHELKSKSQMR